MSSKQRQPQPEAKHLLTAKMTEHPPRSVGLHRNSHQPNHIPNANVLDSPDFLLREFLEPDLLELLDHRVLGELHDQTAGMASSNHLKAHQADNQLTELGGVSDGPATGGEVRCSQHHNIESVLGENSLDYSTVDWTADNLHSPSDITSTLEHSLSANNRLPLPEDWSFGCVSQEPQLGSAAIERAFIDYPYPEAGSHHVVNFEASTDLTPGSTSTHTQNSIITAKPIPTIDFMEPFEEPPEILPETTVTNLQNGPRRLLVPIRPKQPPALAGIMQSPLPSRSPSQAVQSGAGLAHNGRCSGSFPCDGCIRLRDRCNTFRQRKTVMWKACFSSDLLDLNYFYTVDSLHIALLPSHIQGRILSAEYHDRFHMIDGTLLSSCLDDLVSVSDKSLTDDQATSFMARNMDTLVHSCAAIPSYWAELEKTRLSGSTCPTLKSKEALAFYALRMHPRYVAKRLSLLEYEIYAIRRCATEGWFYKLAGAIRQLKSGKYLASPDAASFRVALRTLWIVVNDPWLSLEDYFSKGYMSPVLQDVPDCRMWCQSCGKVLEVGRKALEEIEEQRRHLKEYMDWCLRKYIDNTSCESQVIQTLWLCSRGFNWVPSDNNFVHDTAELASSGEESGFEKSAEEADKAVGDSDTAECREDADEENEEGHSFGAEGGEQMKHESHRPGWCITM
ncbi:hypothetical protein PG985_013681 [Apiospora marii]|uniref:uncharacterized protein n=1 Tax=Apiospora marii TaxID=335849 RepID=UPI00312DB2DC